MRVPFRLILFMQRKIIKSGNLILKYETTEWREKKYEKTTRHTSTQNVPQYMYGMTASLFTLRGVI